MCITVRGKIVGSSLDVLAAILATNKILEIVPRDLFSTNEIPRITPRDLFLTNHERPEGPGAKQLFLRVQ